MIEFKEIKRIVEALIFASDSPVTENRIKNIVEELSVSQIQEIVEEAPIPRHFTVKPDRVK